MGVVAHGAPFPQRLVFEHMRACLLTVTLQTGVILPRDEHAFGLEDILPMRIVAISAIHPSFFNRVVVLEIEQRFFLEMALETWFRISARVNDKRAATAACLHMKAASAMTRFAALTLQSLPFPRNLNARVAGVFEVVNHLFVTQSARFHTHVLRTLDHRRGDEHRRHRRTGNNEYHRCGSNETGHYHFCLELRLHQDPPCIFINVFIAKSRFSRI
jgi:hypothetical protein